MPPEPSRAGLTRTIPALPVRDVPAACAHYRERFGFEARQDWRRREDLSARPVCSGAESFLAGTASCRIEVADVDALFGELEPAGVLHPVSRGGVTTTDFGSREFATSDLDGNLVTFFHWV